MYGTMVRAMRPSGHGSLITDLINAILQILLSACHFLIEQETENWIERTQKNIEFIITRIITITIITIPYILDSRKRNTDP